MGLLDSVILFIFIYSRYLYTRTGKEAQSITVHASYSENLDLFPLPSDF